MAKRQPVPAALREELIEYSSLLRALRTTQTLDVTAHLTQPYANDRDEEDESGPSKSTTPAASTSSSKRKRSESEPQTPHWRNRDQWTRWPIPVKDVPLPDWSLQDEIASIVKHVLAPTNLTSSSPSSEDDDDLLSDKPELVKGEQSPDIELHTDSEDEDDAYYQTLASSITPVIQNKLESLFALISAHTMARPDSMQNRIEPFDWRDLMNILGSPGAAHLVNETILQNVTSRMEELFEITPASTSTSIPPPSPAAAIYRHKRTQASRSHLNSLLSKHTTSLFEQTLPPRNHKYLTSYQITLRQRKKEKKRRKKRHTSPNQDDEDIEEAKAGDEAEIDEIEEDDDSGTSTQSRGKGTNTSKAQMDKGKGKAKALPRTASTPTPKHHSTDEDDEDQDWESESTEDEQST